MNLKVCSDTPEDNMGGMEAEKQRIIYKGSSTAPVFIYGQYLRTLKLCTVCYISMSENLHVYNLNSILCGRLDCYVILQRGL